MIVTAFVKRHSIKAVYYKWTRKETRNPQDEEAQFELNPLNGDTDCRQTAPDDSNNDASVVTHNEQTRLEGITDNLKSSTKGQPVTQPENNQNVPNGQHSTSGFPLDPDLIQSYGTAQVELPGGDRGAVGGYVVQDQGKPCHQANGDPPFSRGMLPTSMYSGTASSPSNISRPLSPSVQPSGEQGMNQNRLTNERELDQPPLTRSCYALAGGMTTL